MLHFRQHNEEICLFFEHCNSNFKIVFNLSEEYFKVRVITLFELE